VQLLAIIAFCRHYLTFPICNGDSCPPSYTTCYAIEMASSILDIIHSSIAILRLTTAVCVSLYFPIACPSHMLSIARLSAQPVEAWALSAGCLLAIWDTRDRISEAHCYRTRLHLNFHSRFLSIRSQIFSLPLSTVSATYQSRTASENCLSKTVICHANGQRLHPLGNVSGYHRMLRLSGSRRE
jgi:hypothetical protein